MAIQHAQPGQAIDIAPLGDRLATERTVALFKSADLEVMRVVLQAGKSLPPHKVPGEITLQCIEGTVAIGLQQQTLQLQAGQLLYLGRDAVHGVTALQDASLLVTVALRP